MPQNPKPQASKQPQVFPKEMPQNPLHWWWQGNGKTTVAEEMKERIKLHWFKIQILEISAVIIVIPARKVFWDRGEDFVNNKWN